MKESDKGLLTILQGRCSIQTPTYDSWKSRCYKVLVQRNRQDSNVPQDSHTQTGENRSAPQGSSNPLRMVQMSRSVPPCHKTGPESRGCIHQRRWVPGKDWRSPPDSDREQRCPGDRSDRQDRCTGMRCQSLPHSNGQLHSHLEMRVCGLVMHDWIWTPKRI